MNDLKLYEKIPQEAFPVRIHCYFEQKYNFHLHWHEHIEIHYFFAGGGQLRYGEEKLTVSAGDCLVINGNQLHRGLLGEGDYLCLIVPPSLLEQNHIIFEHCFKDPRVDALMERIRQVYLTRSSVDLLELRGLIYLLLTHLVRSHALQVLDEGTYSQHFSKLGKVNSAVKFIHENYDKALTTRQLAELVHLSEGYFCQLFREVTGRTAIEYLNRLRIDKAEKLLRKTSLSVTEVASACGFDDANYFSRMFKKIKGENPQAVRRGQKD